MNLIEIFKRKIPSPTQVIEEAIRLKLVPPYDDIEYIKSSFSILVEELQIDAYNLYLKAEEKEGMLAIREHLRGKVRSGATDEEAIEEAAKMFKELDRFFSLSDSVTQAQGRESL